ncbi:TolC family protein [Novosphingobium pokkalii]|uniref:TolC family protein n=1 Tax=Novosphingobium pokkalii TaxID=1770194 RepID=A0ABV7UYZ5_9SPHN|nr:TolC family protein [Novosphingobium pokkalii]GHC99483.1 multidrug transporter [Novosphingobium pokkalii]
MIRTLLAAAAALVWSQGALAAELTLDRVLQASARHQPLVLEAMARSRAADARTLAAQGLFDMVFDVDVQARPLGYYDNALADVKLTRPLATNGGQVYGGYRVSAGRFATYDGKSVTNGLGEVRAGAVFSLLRDRYVDERRTKLAQAQADAEIAGLDQAMVAIGVQRRAADAYQQWVAAGLRMRTYRDLLALARERQASIERQVQLGARPAVLAVENRQNIVRREALLVRSEQDLAVAAQALSLFWRDDLGQPIVATADDLPASFPDGVAPRLADTATVLANRPDLQILMNRAEQARLRGDLAGNDLLPKLDVRVEASKDFGSGSYTRVPGEVLFGVRLSMPLEQRAARGRMAEAQADADALSHRLRLAEQQITADLASLRVQVSGAERLAVLAGDEAQLARRMAEAERRRFALGASDFLPVNLREEAAADAQLRQIDAQYRHAAARAELAASLMDGTSLGLP